MKTERVLITGAGGYLGRRIATELLEHTRHDLVLWLHARSVEEFEAKRARVADLAICGRVELAWGDLADDAPFAGVDRERITRVVHSAARTEFNVERVDAERVNVDGARRVMHFAASCPDLERFVLLSSLYATGLRAGRVLEARANPNDANSSDGFANWYEWSKEAAERVLSEEFSELPASVLRVATVVADDESGAVTQHNAVHNTLKLFFYGLLSVVPGERDTPLYFVTADMVARAARAALDAAEPVPSVHVAPEREHCATLGELLDLVHQAFEEDPGFARRRVLAPLLCDQEQFDLVASAAEGFGGEILTQALKSVAPFAPQLFVAKDVENEQLRVLVDDLEFPDAHALLTSVARELVRTRWGKEAGRAVG